jgi:two-component system, OmpR family, response regulator MtrA
MPEVGMAVKIRNIPNVLIVSNIDLSKIPWVELLIRRLQVNVILESCVGNVTNRWAEVIPDLILFDCDLPETEFIEIVKSVRYETTIPVVAILQQTKTDTQIKFYQAGVDDCLFKPFDQDLFLAKMKIWLRRSWAIPADTLGPLKFGNLQLVPSERIIILENGEKKRLTNLEFRLLYCLMSQPQRIFNSEGLIRQVWGSHGDGDLTTLKNIIYRLRQKIETDATDPKFIKTIVGTGYQFSIENL